MLQKPDERNHIFQRMNENFASSGVQQADSYGRTNFTMLTAIFNDVKRNWNKFPLIKWLKDPTSPCECY